MSDSPARAEAEADPVPAAVQWRCRRGMRELDVLLGRWLNECWSKSQNGLRQAFCDLLDCEDDQLWDWLLGRSLPERPELQRIVHAIRSVPARGR